MKNIFVVMLIFGGLGVRAQYYYPQKEVSQATVLPSKLYRWVLKFAPLSMLDPHSTIQFGAEGKIGKRSTLQQELGYGHVSFSTAGNSTHSKYPDREVWRARTEYRFYYQRTKTPFLGNYFAVDLLFKQLNASRDISIGRACEEGNNFGGFGRGCNYYQYENRTLYRYTWALNFKFGHQLRVPETNFLFDFYAGFGLRYIHNPSLISSLTPLYEGEQIQDASNRYSSRLFEDFQPGNSYFMPSLSGGFKIGYGF